MLKKIKGRRSVRNFQEKPVPREELLQLVEAAIWAPSGSNTQAWSFILVETKQKIEKLSAVSPGLLGQPPALIALLRDLEGAYLKGGELSRDLLSLMDLSMAAQNMMLMAHELGLGTCAIRGFHQQSASSLLSLPEEMSLELLLAVGYPAAVPKAPSRKPVEEVVFYEQYGEEA